MKGLILSHPRCGSSNLLRFISKACNVKGVSEPFNFRALNSSLQGWRELSLEDLKAHFVSVFENIRLAKHIYGQHMPEIDFLVPTLPGIRAIIFLYRENVEAAALSTVMANKLGSFNAKPSTSIGVLNVEEIERFARKYRNRRDIALKHCVEAGVSIKVISYEQLFEENENRRRDALRDVMNFLHERIALPFPKERRWEVAYSEFMAPRKKTNTAATYQFIENLPELKTAFPKVFNR